MEKFDLCSFCRPWFWAVGPDAIGQWERLSTSCLWMPKELWTSCLTSTWSGQLRSRWCWHWSSSIKQWDGPSLLECLLWSFSYHWMLSLLVWAANFRFAWLYIVYMCVWVFVNTQDIFTIYKVWRVFSEFFCAYLLTGKANGQKGPENQNDEWNSQWN